MDPDLLPGARELARRLQSLVLENAAESNTSAWVRDVLCDLCGWKKPHLKAQTLAPRGPIDWHAQVGRNAVLHVEVKRVGRPLKPEMIVRYLVDDAKKARHVFGLLTNGSEWELWAGGREFAKAGVAPFRVGAVVLLHAGEERTRSANTGAIAERLATLLDLVGRQGLPSRWLASMADHEQKAFGNLLEAVLRSTRVIGTWTRQYEALFTGPVPHPATRWRVEKASGRVAPTAVAAVVALRQHTVAGTAHSEMRRLIGHARLPRTRRRVRQVRKRLEEMFRLPGER